MKFLKYTSYVIISLIGISFISYLGFRGIEYLRGNSYVDYLEDNSESVSLGDDFNFELAKKDIKQKSLILVGEIHGFKVPTKFDKNFFSHLRINFDVKDYILEMDQSQAYFMNKFNQTGDQNILKNILENWVVIQGRDNQDYLNRWISLQELYKKHPFSYHGIDKISDVDLLIAHFNEITPGNKLQIDVSMSDSLKLIEVKKRIVFLKEQLAISQPETQLLWNLDHMLKNIDHNLNNDFREEVLTGNLLAVYDYHQLKKRKVYGFFGIFHTLTDEVMQTYKPMALRLKETDPWFETEILNFNFIFCDSYMVMKSSNLPEILQDKGDYTRFPVSFDDIWFGYLFGVEDLKRVTDEKTKTLVKLNSENSPYLKTQRLFNMFKFLPIGTVLNASEGKSTADYGQYMVFVRNSDWAEPIWKD